MKKSAIQPYHHTHPHLLHTLDLPPTTNTASSDTTAICRTAGACGDAADDGLLSPPLSVSTPGSTFTVVSQTVLAVRVHESCKWY